MKALILIDLQNDFMPKGPLAVPNGNKSVDAANFAQTFFNIVIASKDWHPVDHISFVNNHPGKKAHDVIDLNGLKQTLWPKHCVQNTFGAALVKQLNQTQIQHVVNKGEDANFDSYSAFFDNAYRHETGLKNYLALRNIDEIYILGVATEYCVKFSSLDAQHLGIKTHVIIDGCRGIGLNKTDIPRAKEEMLDHGVRLLNLADLNHEF